MKEIDEDEDFDEDSIRVNVNEDMSVNDLPVIEGYLMMRGTIFRFLAFLYMRNIALIFRGYFVVMFFSRSFWYGRKLSL